MKTLILWGAILLVVGIVMVLAFSPAWLGVIVMIVGVTLIFLAPLKKPRKKVNPQTKQDETSL